MAEAWVKIPSNETFEKMRGGFTPGQRHPYDFGFFPAMGRLQMALPRVAMPFSALFSEIMFAPGALARREREMIAAVTAAAQDCLY